MYKVFLCKESNILHLIWERDPEIINYEFNTQKYECLLYAKKRACTDFIEEHSEEYA